MINTTARRDRTFVIALLSVSALVGGACSGDDTTVSPTVPSSPLDASDPSASPPPAGSVDSARSGGTIAMPAPTVPPTAPAAPAATTAAPAVPTAPPATLAPAASTPTDATTVPTAGTVPATAPAEPVIDWTAIITDLLQRHFRISREPSLDLVRDVCIQPSGCYDEASQTVEVLQSEGLRISGGAPFEIVSVEFQGTVDGTPIEDALAANLIVRFIATDQGVVQLVDADGTVVDELAPDERFPPGERTARAVIVGRDDVTTGWKLVALSEWM